MGAPAFSHHGGCSSVRDGATDGLRGDTPARRGREQQCPAGSTMWHRRAGAYARTELFFGKSIPGGGTVTDAAFAQFLDQEVTPRFPAGFTVVPAMGQYRETNGVIDHEASDMLILFYPRDTASDASKKINEIRTAYDKTFHQESVLREDEQPACVSF
jgi:Protein of unknown function (DUF3574)